MQKKKKTIVNLKKEADRIFSFWIRVRDKFTCFTCGKKGDLSSIQNGHYISRGINVLRYDEINCNAQCVGCNVFKHGDMPEYSIRLQMKYGDHILKELHQKKQQFHQFSRQELEEIIEKYKEYERRD